MNKIEKYFAISLITLMFSSCAYIPNQFGYIKKAQAQIQLDSAIAKKNADAIAVEQKIVMAKDAEMAQVENNYQDTSNELYGAQIALKVEPNKSRPILIASTHVDSAAAYAPKPSVDGVLKQQELLAKELNEQKVTNEEIQQRLNKTLDDAVLKQKQLDDAKIQVVAAKQDKESLLKSDDIKIKAAQNDLNNANNKIIAEQNANLIDKTARSKERLWLIGTFTFVGIALGIAAIFSPILKSQFTIGAGCSLAIAIGIVLVPQWVITLVACIFFAGLLGWIAYDIIISHRASSNTYRAIQDIKDNKPEVFAQVKSTLTDWQTKYTKDGSTVPDIAAMNHIDEVLKKTDSL